MGMRKHRREHDCEGGMNFWGLQRVFAATATALLVIGLMTVAQAQDIGVSQTETGPAASYQMPVGQDLSAATAGPPAIGEEAPYPRSPFGDDELKRLKELPSGTPSPEEPTPQRGSSLNAPSVEAIATNCTTNVPTGSGPPDIHGAVGSTNFVVVTNRDIGVYGKSGCGLISRVPFATFFGAGFTIASGESLFDPRVLHDPSSDRFFVSVESLNSNNTDQFQYFAVSKDNTGTTWWLQRIALSQGTGSFCKRAAGTFWDYPNAGSMNSRWFISGTDFGNGAVSGNTGAIMSVDKTPTLSGQSASVTCFFNISATHIAPPIVQDTAGTAYFLSPPFGGSTVRRWALVPTGGPFNASLTETSSIAISAWSIPPDAVQPNGQKIDSLDGRFQSASTQMGTSLWNVHTVAVGSFSRWRLYQFSTTGTTALFTFTPTTDVGNNQDHLFNASVAVNSTTAFVTSSRTIPSNAASGNAAMLIFSGSNNSSSGWVYDLVATSTAQFSIVGSVSEPNTLCNNSQRGSCRWGDYSATQIDPSNSAAAWGFNELANGTTQFDWATRGATVGGPTTVTTPLYRFFNVVTGTHFYTISEAEKNDVIAHLPQFHLEGVAYFANATP